MTSEAFRRRHLNSLEPDYETLDLELERLERTRRRAARRARIRALFRRA